jgi:protein-S-isoprenylcysteine O-methyltransferase Ste14
VIATASVDRRPRVSGVPALTLQNAKIAAIVVVVVLAVLALVVASVVRKLMVKIVTIVLLVGIGVAVWSQRASLQNCAERAKDRAQIGDPGGVICTFFGKSVTVPTA